METHRRERHGDCCLCGRETELTFHHLTPRCQHRKKWAKRSLTREQRGLGINICRKCHSGIHTLYSEKELGKKLNTLESLRADERIQKHVGWVSKQKVRR